MTKVLYNACYGGFGFSKTFLAEVVRRYPEYEKDAKYGLYEYHYRDDPKLVALVEELGTKASSAPAAHIDIDEVPENMEWDINEYDGVENVKWTLPSKRMLDDLAKIIRGEINLEDAHVVTRNFMNSGLSIKEFEQTIR